MFFFQKFNVFFQKFNVFFSPNYFFGQNLISVENLFFFAKILIIFNPGQRNYDSNATFEELQFYSTDAFYESGWEHYADYFPPTNSTKFNFEKSATYFTSSLAPMRMASLLPRAVLIIILRDPAERAYSWYQHQKAHGVKEANNFTFLEVLKSDKNSLGKSFSSRSIGYRPNI